MVTIESKNHSINLGGGGFICLRTKVAELAAPDIFEHYKKSMDGMRLYDVVHILIMTVCVALFIHLN